MSSVTRLSGRFLLYRSWLISSQVLWPALHYAVSDAPKTKLFYESAAYERYVAVNQRFADAIIANYQEGDISESPYPVPRNLSSDHEQYG